LNAFTFFAASQRAFASAPMILMILVLPTTTTEAVAVAGNRISSSKVAPNLDQDPLSSIAGVGSISPTSRLDRPEAARTVESS
jgi:hypothetical protein